MAGRVGTKSEQFMVSPLVMWVSQALSMIFGQALANISRPLDHQLQ